MCSLVESQPFYFHSLPVFFLLTLIFLANFLFFLSYTFVWFQFFNSQSALTLFIVKITIN